MGDCSREELWGGRLLKGRIVGRETAQGRIVGRKIAQGKDCGAGDCFLSLLAMRDQSLRFMVNLNISNVSTCQE